MLLTVGQGPISKICVPKSVGNSWHPCNKEEENDITDFDEDALSDKCASKVKHTINIQYNFNPSFFL